MSADDANDEPALTDIDGIGDSTAENLVNAGFESVGDVADGSADVLADIKGFGPDRAVDVQQDAQDLVADESGGVASDTDAGSDADSDSSDGDAVTVETTDVEIETTEILYSHVRRAVIEEALRYRQRGNSDAEAHCLGLEKYLGGVWMEDVGPEFDADTEGSVTLSLSDDEIRYLHQAISTTIMDYRDKSNVMRLWGDLESVRDQLEAYR